MKKAPLNNYLNLLNDVYSYGSMKAELCRKHQVSNITITTLKHLKLVDQKGQSRIKMRPTMKDAILVSDTNTIRQRQYQQSRQQKPIKPKPIVHQKFVDAKTTEINLFWGMIKIVK
jgi:hypothetical protein